MSRSSSVLNFREIIINGIQDLEQGVKQRSQERSNSQKKASQHQIESPLPCFQSSFQDDSPNNQKDFDLTQSPINNSEHVISKKLENGFKDYNKIQLQQFKIPSFTNPARKDQNNRQNENQGFKLKINNISNQSGFDYQQKENSYFGGGECTFREKKDINYFKELNVDKNTSQQNMPNYGIMRRNEKIENKSNQISTYQDSSNNERQSAFKNNDTSNYIQSPFASRMEQDNNDQNINQLKNSSKFESNRNGYTNIQENQRNVDYFSIYDNPYQDRQNIFKELKISEPQAIPSHNNSKIESPQFDQTKSNKNLLKNNFNRIKSSNNLKGNNPSSHNKSSQQQSKQTINRSSSFKKGINLSPPKKTATSQKKKTLERFPSQISFEDSLRSYQINQKPNQPISQYTVKKENLKKIILNFESDQLRGIYNLAAFIKFFRELGLMQVTQQQENNLQEEIQVVEELWRLLKFASYSAECVSTSFIYQIVLIIIDCQSYKAIQASQLIDTLCQKEYQKYSNFFQQDREKCSIWQSFDIINGIRDALSVSKKNENIFVSNDNKQENSQKAKIAQIFQHTSYFKTEDEQYKPNRSYSQNQLINNSDDDFLLEVQKSNQNSSKKQQQYNENSIDSSHSLKQRDQLNSIGDKSNRKSERDEYLNQKNVHQRLFRNSHSKTRIIQDHLQAKEQKEQYELNQCTFKPEINKNTKKILQKSHSNLQLQKNKESSEQEKQSIRETVKGVKQNLQRMEQAREQRNHQEKYWENQRLKYQNYQNRSPFSKNAKQHEQLINLSPSPQKLRTDKIIREKPMLYVDINITKGKTGKIAIYQGDIPEDVANNFAKIYNLNIAATHKLTKKLKDIIQAYYSQLYDQF
ncbi:hypothetical protein ABPG74_003327 [Tetrahymena malaccensis]